jgi:uncharacterized protein (TIGR03437 family)
VTVKLNGSAIPLHFVGPDQINALVPVEVAAASTIAVSYAGVESALSLAPGVFRADAAPGIFTLSADGQGAVLIAGSGLIAGPSRPARRGEAIEIYATGLGPVNSLSRTLGETAVTIGGSLATVLYSGLAPGFAGVYQVNAIVPQDAAAGDRVPVSIQVNGAPGNTVTIAIQ